MEEVQAIMHAITQAAIKTTRANVKSHDRWYTWQNPALGAIKWLVDPKQVDLNWDSLHSIGQHKTNMTN